MNMLLLKVRPRPPSACCKYVNMIRHVITELTMCCANGIPGPEELE